MNKKQLKFAADTIASIADHLDMPEAQGNCFALISSRESNMVHAITTDNNREELLDMFASALQGDEELLSIVSESLIRAIGTTDPAPSTSYTDPSSWDYWDNENFKEEENDEPEEATRSSVFKGFSEQEQLTFWQVEDSVRDLAVDGVFKLTDLMKYDRLKAYTRAQVEDMLIRCKCELTKSRPVTFDAARSILILH